MELRQSFLDEALALAVRQRALARLSGTEEVVQKLAARRRGLEHTIDNEGWRGLMPSSA
jgi:hypothetical protein